MGADIIHSLYFGEKMVEMMADPIEKQIWNDTIDQTLYLHIME
jgi:hypothetical protein